MIRKAIATTDVTDDEFWRVKLKCPELWVEESEPIPVLNHIYISKGDTVLLYHEGMDLLVVIGRFYDYNQKANRPTDVGPILFQANKDGAWVSAGLTSAGVSLKTSSGMAVTVGQNSLQVETGSTKLSLSPSVEKTEAATIEIKGSSLIKIDGKTQFVNPTGPPTGNGPLCGLKMCLFSGAPHATNTTG